MMEVRSFAILGLLALAACAGRTLDAGPSDGGTTADAHPQGVGTNTDATPNEDHYNGEFDGSPYGSTDDASVVVGTATGPEVVTPSQVAAARRTCALPHGPLVSPSTVGDLRGLLTGSWFLCSTEMTYSGVAYDSMVYDADGHWAKLLADTQGGLVRGVGIDSVGTYTISDNPNAGETDPIRTGGPVYANYASGGGNGLFASFEMDPDRMQIVIGTAGTVEWFVRIATEADDGGDAGQSCAPIVQADAGTGACPSSGQALLYPCGLPASVGDLDAGATGDGGWTLDGGHSLACMALCNDIPACYVTPGSAPAVVVTCCP
jgi:hypothetical protein